MSKPDGYWLQRRSGSVKNEPYKPLACLALSHHHHRQDRVCPSLERSRIHCPPPPFTILSPLPSSHQADVERPQVLFNRTKPSSSWSTGRSFPIVWQSRNNGSKSTCI